MIPSRIHSIIDYGVGLLLIALPWLMGFVNFDHDVAATYVPILNGILIIGMSLITNYEYSVAKMIPFKIHLNLDLLSALFLGASPWLFNFHEYVHVPHLSIAIAELGGNSGIYADTL